MVGCNSLLRVSHRGSSGSGRVTLACGQGGTSRFTHSCGAGKATPTKDTGSVTHIHSQKSER